MLDASLPGDGSFANTHRIGNVANEWNVLRTEWTGVQSGDSFPTPFLSVARWACGNFQITALHNISAEVSALSFTVEMITDQG